MCGFSPKCCVASIKVVQSETKIRHYLNIGDNLEGLKIESST